MKRPLMMALAAGVLVVATQPGVASGAGESPLPSLGMATSDAVYLFVMTADDGSLTPIDGDEDRLELVLNGVDPYLTYFTDSPQRDAGVVAAEEMVDLLFVPEEPAPNAALLLPLAGEDVTLAVELTRPSYSAEDATMTFVAELLTEATLGMASLRYAEASDGPTEFESPKLFIDSPRCARTIC